MVLLIHAFFFATFSFHVDDPTPRFLILRKHPFDGVCKLILFP
jgi:hypothetical protein